MLPSNYAAPAGALGLLLGPGSLALNLETPSGLAKGERPNLGMSSLGPGLLQGPQ